MSDIDPTTVIITVPHKMQRGYSTTESETWISMLEQQLACQFDGYTLTVTTDSYKNTVEVIINFATVEDAVWFKLKRT
jgi:hypothetical protein